MADSNTTTPPAPGFVVWLLGPTSAGKTTIARPLAARLGRAGPPCLHFDGDEMRALFGDDLGFAVSDRRRVVGALAMLAKKTAESGANAVVSALTASDDARRLIAETVDDLIVVHVHCSIETCMARDPKGLYAKANNGEIDTLIGVNTPYVAPEKPDFDVDTETLSPDDAVDAIMDFLRHTGRVGADG